MCSWNVLQFLAGFLVFPPGGRSFLSLCSLWWSWSSRRDMLEYVGMVQDSEFNKGPQGENKGLKKGLYGWRVMNGKIWRTTPTEYTVMRFTGVVWPLLLSWTLALIFFSLGMTLRMLEQSMYNCLEGIWEWTFFCQFWSYSVCHAQVMRCLSSSKTSYPRLCCWCAAQRGQKLMMVYVDIHRKLICTYLHVFGSFEFCRFFCLFPYWSHITQSEKATMIQWIPGWSLQEGLRVLAGVAQGSMGMSFKGRRGSALAKPLKPSKPGFLPKNARARRGGGFQADNARQFAWPLDLNDWRIEVDWKLTWHSDYRWL